MILTDHSILINVEDTDMPLLTVTNNNIII